MSKNQNRLQKPQTNIQNQKTVSHKAQATSSLKLPLLLVFMVPVLLYFQTLSFGFVGFDDDMILVNSHDFFSHFSNIFHAFSTDALTTKQSLFYRPMQTISYIFDVLISGTGKTWMFHFTNVVLIGCIASAIFLLLKQFKIPQKLAIAASILYCVHPLFVSTVAWIPARGDLQLTLFSLLSLYFFIQYSEHGKKQALILNIIFYSIALFCKETAAMLPILFALYILCFTDKKLFDKKQIMLFAVYGVIGLQWFWMRSQAIVSIAKQEDSVGFSSMYTMIKTIPESLAKFYLPFNIPPIPSFTIMGTSIGIVLLLAIALLFFVSKTSSTKSKLFFVGWFFLFMIPTLFFKHTLIDYLDHRFLLPLIGIFIFVLTNLPQKWVIQLENKKLWIVIVITSILGFNTFIKTKAYASQTTFYNEALAKNTQSCFIYYNRGCININDMGPLGQKAEYTKAIALKPDYFLFYLNRGSSYSDLKMYDSAIVDFTKTIALKPDYANAYYNRGYIYRQLNFVDKALIDYSKAIELNPSSYSAILNRANSYSFIKQFDKAIADYTRAIELRPDSINPYHFRAIIYEQLKENDKAIADYTSAIAINPSKVELYFNRGNVYNTKGMPDKAIEDYTKAIALNPNHGDALNNRGNTYYIKGMLDLACQDFEKAEKLGVEAAKTNRAKLCK